MMVSISYWIMLVLGLMFTHINARFFPKPPEYIVDLSPVPSGSECDSLEESSSSLSELEPGDGT